MWNDQTNGPQTGHSAILGYAGWTASDRQGVGAPCRLDRPHAGRTRKWSARRTVAHVDYTVFTSLDSWIRERLRSILRKRAGRRGRGRGADHQRWPNRFFDDQRLYSLVTAHESLLQSLTGS